MCPYLFLPPLKMCLRINNIHLLISVFPTFESHLHSTTRKEPHKPATAFGYISSDVGDQSSPLHHPHASHYGVETSLRPQADKDVRGTPSDQSLMPADACTCTCCVLYISLYSVSPKEGTSPFLLSPFTMLWSEERRIVVFTFYVYLSGSLPINYSIMM